MKLKYNQKLVPIMSRANMENIACDFLTRYCPEALEKAMPIPIEEIATKHLGIKIKDNIKLSEELIYLGCTIFTDGECQIYDPIEDEYINPDFCAGTIIIDKDVGKVRGNGSKRYTLTHEIIHWEYHNKYHLLHCQISGNQAIAHRSVNTNSLNSIPSQKWNDEEWMEWQAETLSSYILLPKNSFIKKFNEIKQKYAKETSSNIYMFSNVIKVALAEFFEVSETTARIRMENLGLIPKSNIYKII